MRRTDPLPPFDPDTAAVRIRRHGDRARRHLEALRRPFTFSEYPVDYGITNTSPRWINRRTVYLAVDMLVNSAAVNVALRNLEGVH